MAQSIFRRSPALDVSAAWQSQLARAQQQPWLLQELISHGHELFPRFSRYYAQLSALPRKTRRALKKQFAHSLAGAALLLALSPGSGLAAMIEVNSATDAIANDNACTLREAIIAANTNMASGDTTNGCPAGDAGADTITFASNNTYTLDLTGAGEDAAATGDLDITEALTITGNGEANTIIDGNQTDRIFDIRNQVPVTIEQVTIQNGLVNVFVAGEGGGIRNGVFDVFPFLYGGSLTIRDTTLTASGSSDDGGGLFNFTSGKTLTIENSTISNNRAEDGGGVFSFAFGGMVTIENSTVSGNTAIFEGGGMFSFAFGGMVTIENSTVSGNTAIFDGGGVCSFARSASAVTIENSTISNNTARNGGGVDIRARSSSTAMIVNSTVSGNMADDGGGVFSYANASTAMIVNSTISNNTAADGGGVFSYANASTAMIVNSTVSGNTASYGGGVFSYAANASTAMIVNSTISGNTASYGGGVRSRALDTSTSRLERSVVSGNSAGTGAEVHNVIGLTADASNVFGHSGLSDADAFQYFTPGASDINATSSDQNILLADILDTTLADNGGPTLTHALVSGSPAIDLAGTCGLPTDQRGEPRTTDACDSGAFEYGDLPPTDPCDGAVASVGVCKVNGVPGQDCQGGPGDDVIIGFGGDDTILGGGGNDTLRGAAGNDLLCGEAGDDTLLGGTGLDTLVGAAGEDVLKGERDDDILLGGPDNDILRGGNHDDELDGEDGDDKLFGDGGDDMLEGGIGTDTLDGGGNTDACTDVDQAGPFTRCP